LACPFFVPTERADDLAFPHPARLPLGAAWRGTCAVQGHEHDVLNNQQLESCNLGYAKSCSRLPHERTCDAVRIGICKDSGTRLSLQLVLESEHRPAGRDLLEFDALSGEWISVHPEIRIQRLAQCHLRAYLERRER